MENKTKHDWERDLLLKLREVVNEKDGFDYVEAELASLGFFEAGRVFDRQPIDTMDDAIRFLQQECSYLVAQMEVVPPHWKVVSLDGQFDKVLESDEMINFAREQRDARLMRSREVSDGRADRPQSN